PADEGVEQLVVLGQRLEVDPFRSREDLEAALAHVHGAGRLHVEERWRRRDLGRAVRYPGLRVEPGEIREPPVPVLRRRRRQRPIALEWLGAGHASNLRWSMSAFPSGSLNHAWRHTPVSTVSPSNATPFASSSWRAASTSSTRMAMPAELGANSCPMLDGSKTSSVTCPRRSSMSCSP